MDGRVSIWYNIIVDHAEIPVDGVKKQVTVHKLRKARQVTVGELLDILWCYMVRHDDYPTRAELHKQHRGVLPTIRDAIALRYVSEQLDPDGSTTLRITEKGYDLLRELDHELGLA